MFAKELTRHLKRYDRELFAERSSFDGLTCVYRKKNRFESVWLEEIQADLVYPVAGKEFVLALTDTWQRKGQPRAWGSDFILNKLREMDLQANERFFEEMDRANERAQESGKRDFRNKAEAFFSDHRREFAKATDGILTHSLSKDEPRKRRLDRSIKNGNSK